MLYVNVAFTVEPFFALPKLKELDVNTGCGPFSCSLALIDEKSSLVNAQMLIGLNTCPLTTGVALYQFFPHLLLSAVTMYVILAVRPAGIGLGETEIDSPSETLENDTFIGVVPMLATFMASLFCPFCERFPSFISVFLNASEPLCTGYNSLSASFFSCAMPRSLSTTGFFTFEMYTVNVLSNGYGPSSFEYVADILPLFPGNTGSLVHFTPVHPQDDTTLYMTIGLSEMLVAVNAQFNAPCPNVTSPKSWMVLSKRTTPSMSVLLPSVLTCAAIDNENAATVTAAAICLKIRIIMPSLSAKIFPRFDYLI